MNADSEMPKDYESLRSLVLERRDFLPKRIAQIAAYALDNPDEIAFGTAASIAASAGVQPSTLVRFAQHLGFDGFSSLQFLFRERLRERHTSYEERLEALRGDNQGGVQTRCILDGFLAAATRSLEAASRSIDDDLLQRAVDVLKDAETIYLLARRRSYPIASYLAYAFGKLNIRYQLIESSAGFDPEIQSFATQRDAVVAVSFSPYAPMTTEGVQQFALRGVPVVAITDSAFSPLSVSGTVWFEVVEADYEGFRSLAATMALAMTLAVAVAERRRF